MVAGLYWFQQTEFDETNKKNPQSITGDFFHY